MALWIGAAHAATTSAEDGGAELLRFDLPVQPLEMSLAVFGRVTGYSVLVASSLTAARPPRCRATTHHATRCSKC